jgi:hypothetical protein
MSYAGSPKSNLYTAAEIEIMRTGLKENPLLPMRDLVAKLAPSLPGRGDTGLLAQLYLIRRLSARNKSPSVITAADRNEVKGTPVVSLPHISLKLVDSEEMPRAKRVVPTRPVVTPVSARIFIDVLRQMHLEYMEELDATA